MEPGDKWQQMSGGEKTAWGSFWNDFNVMPCETVQIVSKNATGKNTQKTGSMLKLSFWYGSSLILFVYKCHALDFLSFWLANKKPLKGLETKKKKGVKQSKRTGRWFENKHNHHSLEKMNSQIQTNSLDKDYPFRLWGCSVSFVVFVGNSSNT